VIVESLHRRFVFGHRVRALVNCIAPLPPRHATILDIGCGDGTLGEMLAVRRSDIRITGADVLLRPGAGRNVVWFDGVHLPFEDDLFDVALLVDVLHHTDDPTVLLREAYRVAKCVILKDHVLRGVGARATLAAMDWVGNAPHGVRLPYNYWTDKQWRDAFACVHLDIMRWETSLHLYPLPFSWAFDRDLHFVAVLSRGR
jgi:SAM-dependent methyltransferase